MDTVRDLSEVDLWQDSLQRSLARRGRLPRSSPELARLRPARDLTDQDFMREYAAYWRMRRDAATKRPLMPAVGVGGTIALLAATLPSLLGGKSASARSERVAYIDNSAQSLKPTPRIARPAARPERRLVIGGAAQAPTVERGTTVQPAPQPAVTTAQPAPQPVATTTEAATTTIAQVPTTTTQAATTHPRTVAHHTTRHLASDAAPSSKPTAPATHPAVAATVAQTTAPVVHAASDTSGAQSSGQPQSSGGTSPQAPQSTRRHANTGGTKAHSGTNTSVSTTTSTGSSHRSAASGGAGVRGPRRSTGTGSSGYVNPFVHASVTPERIDQGVDYGGSGPLAAIGAGKITYVGTSGTGWPGAFIEFRLLNGPDAGRYVYYAEGITPASGLHVGQRVNAGQVIARMTSGIEVGWGANIGTETYARAHGQWGSGADSGNYASPAGKDFSGLIASLGGPPGKIEG